MSQSLTQIYLHFVSRLASAMFGKETGDGPHCETPAGYGDFSGTRSRVRSKSAPLGLSGRAL
jgi:hypothetical protein